MTTLTEEQAERWRSHAWNGHYRILMRDGRERRAVVYGWAPAEYGDGLYGGIIGDGISNRMWRRTSMVALMLKAARLKPTEASGACCHQGVRIPCVCSRAYSCPVHGEVHEGSHE